MRATSSTRSKSSGVPADNASAGACANCSLTTGRVLSNDGRLTTVTPGASAATTYGVTAASLAAGTTNRSATAPCSTGVHSPVRTVRPPTRFGQNGRRACGIRVRRPPATRSALRRAGREAGGIVVPRPPSAAPPRPPVSYSTAEPGVSARPSSSEAIVETTSDPPVPPYAAAMCRPGTSRSRHSRCHSGESWPSQAATLRTRDGGDW